MPELDRLGEPVAVCNADAVDRELELEDLVEVGVEEGACVDALPEEGSEPLGLRPELKIRRSALVPEGLRLVDEVVAEQQCRQRESHQARICA